MSTPRIVRVVLSNNKQQLQVLLCFVQGISLRYVFHTSVLLLRMWKQTVTCEFQNSASQHRYRLFLFLLIICKYVVLKVLECQLLIVTIRTCTSSGSWKRSSNHNRYEVTLNILVRFTRFTFSGFLRFTRFTRFT